MRTRLEQAYQELDTLLARHSGIEPVDWPLHDKIRLMAIGIDQQHATDSRHEVQDDLRRAADILELHTIYALKMT